MIQDSSPFVAEKEPAHLRVHQQVGRFYVRQLRLWKRVAGEGRVAGDGYRSITLMVLSSGLYW